MVCHVHPLPGPHACVDGEEKNYINAQHTKSKNLDRQRHAEEHLLNPRAPLQFLILFRTVHVHLAVVCD